MTAYLKLFASFLVLIIAVLSLLWWRDSEIFALKVIEVDLTQNQKTNFFSNKWKENLENKLEKKYTGKYIWQVNLEDVLGELKGEKRFQSVKIRRQLPEKIIVSLVPYESILLMMGNNGNLIPVAQDASLMAEKSVYDLPDLPVLRGINFHSDQKLRERAIELILSLPSDSLISAQRVSEIRFGVKEGFTLVMTETGVLIKLGHDKFAFRAQLVDRVLNYLSNNQLQGRVIDGRLEKKVVVRLRNAP